jgi:DNA-binding winged helix-turn-helix (wHTH) protein/tetratricopeptide (TPR) repeat protein
MDPTAGRFRFGPFELDPAGAGLAREGRSLALQPKPLALLALLVEQRHRVVSKAELRRAVWAGVAVSDAALASALRDLRRALGDRDGRFVQTLRGRGFRFVHPIEELDAAGEEAPASFVGRRELLGALGRQVEAAGAGRGQLVFLTGEAGIGKTRTALELAARARRRGFAVHLGRCLEEAGAPPYRPWSQILREVLERGAPAALDAATAGVVERLWRLPAPAPARAAEEGEELRFALFDAAARTLAAASAERPRLLLLDDLHRADASSLRLLRHVAGEITGLRVLLLGTYRDGELPAGHPLGAALADVHPAGTRLPVGGLSPSEVGELVRLTSGREPSAELAATLHARTNGNPLFVEEIARALAAEGALGAPDAAARASRLAPEGTRQVIRSRIARLAEPDRRVLEVAAVIGREFEAPLIGAAAPELGPGVAGALQRALEAGLAAQAEPARFRFVHILVRDALYRDLPAGRRAGLHAAVGRALERLDPLERDARAESLAHHFEEAALHGESGRAVRWGQRAAELAIERAAYDEAIGYATRALRSAAAPLGVDGAEDPVAAAEGRRARPALLVLLGRARWFAGATDEAREAFRQAADAARAAGAADLLARAALGYAGRTDATPGVNRPAVALLEEALAALPEEASGLRAELLARLGTELYYDGVPERADAATLEALALAERSGDEALLAYALSARHYTLTRPDVHPRERLAIGERLVGLAERCGARDTQALGLQERFLDLLELGDGLRMDKTFDAHAKLVAELRQPFFRWMGLLFQGLRAFLGARLAEAERLAHEALALGQGFGTPNAVGAFACQLYAVRREQGRLAELEAPLRTMVREQPDLPVFRTALAALAAETGRRQEAADAVGSLLSGLEAFPRDQHWLPALSLLAPACVAAGEPPFVRRIFELLAPYDGRMVAVGYGSASNGAVSHHLGVLALALGDGDGADEHFEAARALHRRAGAPLWVAHTQREHARALWKRGTPGDREQARGLQAEAIAAYERFDLPYRAQQARELAGAA